MSITPRKVSHRDTSTDDEEVIVEPKRKRLSGNAGKLQALNQVSTLSSSAEERIERASMHHYREHIEEGDLVIIHVSDGSYRYLYAKRGRSLDMKKGNLRHDYLIGRPYGSKISTTAGFVYALRPNPILWSYVLKRHTQINYQHDIATVISLLDVKPGFVIAESGTGSGTLTHAFAVAVGKEGHVYTHDVEDVRVKGVEHALSLHGLGERVTSILSNVYDDGFFIKNSCDGIFLDLPEPWRVIGHCKEALSQTRGGNVVSFSPCIEQCVRTIEQLQQHDFHLIETIEVVPTQYKVAKKKQRRIFDKKDAKLEKSLSAPVNSIKSDEAAPVKQSTSDDTDVLTPETEETYINTTPDDTPPKEQSVLKEYLIPKPVKQPTHSGYLVYAKMFPVYVDQEE